MTEPMTLTAEHADFLRKIMPFFQALKAHFDDRTMLSALSDGAACLGAIADAIEAAIKARDAAVPVGTATQGYGAASNRTFANFLIDKVPEGTKLYTAPPAQPVNMPDGWVLVPREPTWDQRNEARELLIDGIEKEPERLGYVIYKAMLAAVPQPPAQEKDHE